jgi:hypothetical protein
MDDMDEEYLARVEMYGFEEAKKYLNWLYGGEEEKGQDFSPAPEG